MTDARDIETRLRMLTKRLAIYFSGVKFAEIDEAADTIASLRKQLEDAREALRQIRDCTTEHGGAAKALRIINEALKAKS